MTSLIFSAISSQVELIFFFENRAKFKHSRKIDHSSKKKITSILRSDTGSFYPFTDFTV